MDWDDKPIIKYALMAVVVILIIAGLSKCSKKEVPELIVPPSSPEVTQPLPQLAQNMPRKPAVSATAPVVIDDGLIPRPRTPEKDPDEEKGSGPPMF